MAAAWAGGDVHAGVHHGRLDEHHRAAVNRLRIPHLPGRRRVGGCRPAVHDPRAGAARRLAVRGVWPAAAVCDWLGGIPCGVGGLVLFSEPARADCRTSRAGAGVRALSLDAQRDRHGRLSGGAARHGIGRHHCCGGHRRRDGPPAGRPTHRRIRLALHLHRRGAPCADDDPAGRCLPAARAASAASELRLSWRGACLCGVGLAGGRP